MNRPNGIPIEDPKVDLSRGKALGVPPPALLIIHDGQMEGVTPPPSALPMTGRWTGLHVEWNGPANGIAPMPKWLYYPAPDILDALPWKVEKVNLGSTDFIGVRRLDIEAEINTGLIQLA